MTRLQEMMDRAQRITPGLLLAGLLAGCGGTPRTKPVPVRSEHATLRTQVLVSYGGDPGPEGEVHTAQSREGEEHCEASLTYNSIGVFSGVAGSDAAFAALRGEALVEGRGTLFPYQTAHTSGAFTDRLTFTGSAGEGSVVYRFSLKGTATGSGLVGANVYLRHGEDADEELAEYVTFTGDFASVPHAVTFGTPVDVRVVMMCDAVLHRKQTGESACRFTLTLESIDVLDASMRPVPGAAIRSESGTAYAATP